MTSPFTGSLTGYYRLQVNVTGPRETVFQDEQAVLECVAFGPKPAAIYWLKNGEKLSQVSRQTFANNVLFSPGSWVPETGFHETLSLD